MKRPKEQHVKEYNPNKGVKVKVVNKPVYEDDVFAYYERKVTITVNAGDHMKALDFKSDEDIAKWIETVEFENPQQELIPNGA